jgi:lipopolysaccharide transport system ATP-binding protein
MSDTIIQVENLGKKYIIGHQQEGRASYKSFRETMANGVKSLLNSFQKPKGNIENPSKEEFWALKDVSFEIKQGDRVGIIGRNGAGKSTLLKILSRITEPTTGRIKIKGRVASLLEVGTGFHPELTGRENIFLNGAILGMGKEEIKRKFDEIVAFAEIEKFLDTPVKRYSSGMYVRLAFAVAAHLEPEILIVDEVLAVGDAQFQKKCLGKMEDVGKEGRTVLFVSHNMAAVKKLCDRGILFKNGNLILENEIEQVLTSYQSDINDWHDQVVEIRNDFRDFIKMEEFRINKIGVVDLNDQPIRFFYTGNSLKIVINYTCSKKIVSPAFIISCQSAMGVELFQLSTDPISGYTIGDMEIGNGTIELYLKDLSLLGGVYYFDISLARARIKRFFTLKQVIRFNIESTDVYNSGLSLCQDQGLMAINHKWNLIK